MRKIAIILVMALNATFFAQNFSKKCKTCGRFLSECQYKGNHPKTVPASTTGTLSITSMPSDASVKIDGEYMGTTPLTLSKQKAGTCKVTFSAEGYETIMKPVTVTAGKTTTCSATLKKKQAQPTVVQQPEVQQPILTTASLPSSQTITANGVSFKIIRVDGGTFTMGATPEQGSDAFDGEKPAHRVTLSSYYIGQTEVTQALWEAVMSSNPSKFKGFNRPVEHVSWEDCKTFISKLNSITGKNFRLPSEAEWEYAARGGNKNHGNKYSGSNTPDEVAWYKDNSGMETHDVMTKLPNELGLYDMSGNVGEWCSDLYGNYSSSHQSNPSGPSSGIVFVARGGCWFVMANATRVTHRVGGGNATDSAGNGLGLRLAL